MRAAAAFKAPELPRAELSKHGFRGELNLRFSVSDNGEDFLIIGEQGLQIDGKPNQPINGWFTRLDNKERNHYVNGKLHHDTEPAIVFPDQRGGIYYQQGKIHREDGFAIDMVTHFGDQRKVKCLKGLKHADGEPASITISENGVQYIGWYQHNQLHREDGAAYTVIDAEGKIISEEYYQRGMLHREDGPALMMKNLTEYRQEGELHRLDGPAVIKNGIEEYYMQGLQSDRSAVSKAFIENRNQTIGKAKKSDTIQGSDEDKRKTMLSNIENWKREKEQSQAKPKGRRF